MSNKFLIGIAAAFFAVFAIGVGAIVGITRLSDETTISDVSASTPAETSHVPTPAFVPFEPKVQSVDESTASAGITATPAETGKPTGIVVSNSDIDQLATAVKLGEQRTGDVGKDVWARETPVAKRLLNGMCDCDQRNWLKHFVMTGDEAVAGSENYYQSVQLLATLRRNDTELSANQARH